MKVLSSVSPTPEQLTVIRDYKPGVTVVRGAAGSGKTTTALLRLSFLSAFWRTRRTRERLTDPVRVLVLTYNRTLKGYIEALAEQQLQRRSEVVINVTTFGQWARRGLPRAPLVHASARKSFLVNAGKDLGYRSEFLVNEADYLLGRFLPADLEQYLTVRRELRGRSPRVDSSARRQLLDEVVYPYNKWKRQNGTIDWNDLAVQLADTREYAPYDVVIVDEAQDFSANEVRAVMNHVAVDHSVTFVLDAAQRIYPKHFQWREAGIVVLPSQTFRLTKNHRNTVEIAAFARPLLEGLEISDDGTLPDFDSCEDHGDLPRVVKGTFSAQSADMVRVLKGIPLHDESVGILHPKGGRWFDFVRSTLRSAHVPFVELSRQSDWPTGSENVALSTLHSAKGLEFDHVFIVGLNSEVTPHGTEEGDSELDNLRRLVAMAVGRSKKTVTLSYKPTEPSTIVEYLQPGTYVEVDV